MANVIMVLGWMGITFLMGLGAGLYWGLGRSQEELCGECKC